MQPTLAPAPHPMRAHQSGEKHGDPSDHALREQLLASVQQHNIVGAPPPPPPPQSMHGLPDQKFSSPTSLQQHHHQHHHQQQHQHNHNIDPAIAGTSVMHANPAEDRGEEIVTDGRKGKRELATSKRAAQNRLAQRAFRQRKEGHIKSLETQVREYNILNDSFKELQLENYALRDYIISLQSRLLEAQGEFPSPPTNINLQLPSAANTADRARVPTAPMRSYVSDELQASAAQAVANHRKEEAAFSNEQSPDTKVDADKSSDRPMDSAE